MNSRQKGKRGELEWSHWLTERGHPARRSQQYSGTAGTSDVTCDSLGAFHLEVKRTERLALYPAMAQAERDAAGKVPVVAYRANRGGWVVVMRAEDWLRLAGKPGPLPQEHETCPRAPARETTHQGGNPMA